MFPQYQSRQIKPRFEWHPKIDPDHPLSIGCVGLWLLNEAGGLSAYDLSGNNNHGTLTNQPTWTPGRFGQALSFDGVDDYVDCGGDASLKPILQISVEAWIKFYSLIAGVRFLSDWHQSSTADRWLFYSAITDEVQWYLCNAGAGTASVGYSITAGIWYHIVGIYDGSNMKLFINGNLVGSNPISGELNSGTGTVRFGKQAEAGDCLDGLIDEVRLYNRALSAQEIQWLYQSPYDNLIVEPLRKFWFIPEVAAGGGTINLLAAIAEPPQHPTPWQPSPGHCSEISAYRALHPILSRPLFAKSWQPSPD